MPPDHTLPPTAASTDGARLAEGLRLALFTDTFPPQVNGVARTLERLAAAVRDRGGEVRVFTPADPEAQEEREDVVRFPSMTFWAYPQLRLSAPAARRAERELRAWRPTLVHAATPFGVGLAGRSAARALGIPLVTSYHTSFSAYASFYRLGVLSNPGWAFLRWFHNSGLRTYVPTRAIATEIEGHGFERVAIWSRGIDGHRFSPAFRSAEVRRSLGAGEDDVLVTYVGRIAIEKGLDVAVDAMRLVRERAEGRRIVFAIAGGGPYEAQMRKLAPEGTHFAGMLGGDALSRFYAAGDVFVFPSLTDTFGNVLLEAMASGVPVLGADAGPTRELLGVDEPGDVARGAIFAGGDAAAMADAIVALAADPARRALLHERGLAFAARNSWGAVFDALVRDYRAAMREASVPAPA